MEKPHFFKVRSDRITVWNVLPWNFIGIEVLIGVGLAEKLHPEDGENVDDNDKEESEVAKSTQS